MQFVLLSGGSGKRLWPISNDARSKQFIKIFPRMGGEKESMIQRNFRQLTGLYSPENITIATAKSQVSSVQNQLGAGVRLCVEPERRDTFPAMALVAAYLREKVGCRESEPVVVFPVDPYVERPYFEALGRLAERVAVSQSELVLLGIEPTYPSEKYGYILPEFSSGTSRQEDKSSIYARVRSFTEKPDEWTAARYIEQGGLWNGGVFACHLGYLLKKTQELLPWQHYNDLLEHYAELPRISFDYAVVEKEIQLEVMHFAGIWKDLGTWNTITEAMESHIQGKGLLDDSSVNVHIVNELDVPVIGLGVRDMVVAASPEGVLVADKEQSSYLKPLVERLGQRTMMGEKSWGSFRIMDESTESLTLKVTLEAGNGMNYHAHERRSEAWIITAGKGQAIIDGTVLDVAPGDTVRLPCGCKHMLMAGDVRLEAVEVQVGKDITVQDKVIFSLENPKRNG
ncbi:MAG: cupin domain-containing protein [Selenomonas ruminantium]|uniref:Cupin domain-containing protein n=1 Tax=Selenomonas ruminantium TaxID=971 RepID=A0A927WNK7_SELRU|nr:cupin domain-containing protein [Selenomonas ruminantium]